MSIKRGLGWLKHVVRYLLHQTSFKEWTRPTTEGLVIGTGLDLARSKQVLIAENALLRQQLVIRQRQGEATGVDTERPLFGRDFSE